MSKYQYIDGERRYHRGVIIWYDLKGQQKPGYTDIQHWYIVMITQFSQRSPSVNPPTRYHIYREYFSKLADAKQFIDNF